MFGRKAWYAFVLHFFAFGKCISNLEISCVVQANNISGIRNVYNLFLFCKEGIWATKFQCFAVANMQIRRISFKSSRNNFHKSQTVTVLRVHICVNLKNETRKFFFVRLHQTRVALFWAWSRGYFNETIQQLAHPKIIKGRSEKNGLKFSFQIFVTVKIWINFINQF